MRNVRLRKRHNSLDDSKFRFTLDTVFNTRATGNHQVFLSIKFAKAETETQNGKDF